MVFLKLILGIFILLILTHIHSILFKPSIIEGLDGDQGDNSGTTYKDPGLQNDPKQGPLYLGTINASNITYLKSQIDGIQSLKQQIMDVSGHTHANSQAIAAINQQLVNSGNKVTGRDPPKTTVPMG